MADTIEIPQSEVVSQEGATVGDENLSPREPTSEVVSEQAAAQVSPPRSGAATEVPVHETYVKTDEFITDPSSPLAVQVPDAGRGDASVPIHALVGQTVEQVFADVASKETEVSDEDRAKAAETGTTAESARTSS